MESDPRMLTIDQAANRLGIGRTLLRRMLAAGELPSVHLGRRHFVPSPAIDRFVARAASGSARQPTGAGQGPEAG